MAYQAINSTIVRSKSMHRDGGRYGVRRCCIIQIYGQTSASDRDRVEMSENLCTCRHTGGIKMEYLLKIDYGHLRFN